MLYSTVKQKETIDIVESVNKVLATKIDTSNIVSVENKYKAARKELEKLNKELEKAKLADIKIAKALVGW